MLVYTMTIYTSIYKKGETLARSEAEKRAQKEYRLKRIAQYNLNLHREKDMTLIEKLEREKNKKGYASYIKSLIRQDLRREFEDDYQTIKQQPEYEKFSEYYDDLYGSILEDLQD